MNDVACFNNIPIPPHREKVYPIHKYSNGGKSFYIDTEYVSSWQLSKSKVRSDGSILPDWIPSTTALERLIIGTDDKRSYIRFQVLRFTKRHETLFQYDFPEPVRKPYPETPFEYVGDENMERFTGISFTPETMMKIIEQIKELL